MGLFSRRSVGDVVAQFAGMRQDVIPGSIFH